MSVVGMHAWYVIRINRLSYYYHQRNMKFDTSTVVMYDRVSIVITKGIGIVSNLEYTQIDHEA